MLNTFFVHIFAQNKYTMKDLAEFLTMRIGALENELAFYQQKQQTTKEGLSEAIQLLIDLTDPNCPREYTDVVKDEIKRLSTEHFLRNH